MAQIYHSGTALDGEGRLVTAGGRVLGVSCVADDLGTAIEKAYAAADEISWDGMILRRDIGKRALGILRENRQ